MTVTRSTDEQDPLLIGSASARPRTTSTPRRRAIRPRARDGSIPIGIPRGAANRAGPDPHLDGTGVRRGQDMPDAGKFCAVLIAVLIEPAVVLICILLKQVLRHQFTPSDHTP